MQPTLCKDACQEQWLQAYSTLLRGPAEFESTRAVSDLMQNYFLKLLSRYRNFVEPDFLPGASDSSRRLSAPGQDTSALDDCSYLKCAQPPQRACLLGRSSACPCLRLQSAVTLILHPENPQAGCPEHVHLGPSTQPHQPGVRPLPVTGLAHRRCWVAQGLWLQGVWLPLRPREPGAVAQEAVHTPLPGCLPPLADVRGASSACWSCSWQGRGACGGVPQECGAGRGCAQSCVQ